MKQENDSELNLERRSIKSELSKREEESLCRIDQFLAARNPDIARTLIKKLVQRGQISALKGGTETVLEKRDLKKAPSKFMQYFIEIPPAIEGELIAEDIPLHIYFEDEDLCVFEKPAGLVTHPGAGNWSGTLANALAYHFRPLQQIGDALRPGIVHRLDKGTSGVMVAAKNQLGMDGLTDQFSVHTIERRYLAILSAKKLEQGGRIESLIARHPKNRLKMSTKVGQGKKAVSYFRLLKAAQKHALVEFKLETGRTHQIRVHAAEILRSPIYNDSLYGLRDKTITYEYPFLHAAHLAFTHPRSGQVMKFDSPPPLEFEKKIGDLF